MHTYTYIYIYKGKERENENEKIPLTIRQAAARIHCDNNFEFVNLLHSSPLRLSCSRSGRCRRYQLLLLPSLLGSSSWFPSHSQSLSNHRSPYRDALSSAVSNQKKYKDVYLRELTKPYQ